MEQAGVLGLQAARACSAPGADGIARSKQADDFVAKLCGTSPKRDPGSEPCALKNLGVLAAFG